MSDTYTLTPSVIIQDGGSATLSYTSSNITIGTEYTLKSNTGTSLGSKTIGTFTSFAGPGSSEWVMAGDSSDNVYSQNIGTKSFTVYNSSGVSTSTVSSTVTFISSSYSSDPNKIYFAGSGYLSIYNVSSKTFTNYSTVPSLFAIGYNPNDGYVYGCAVNYLHLYKIEV